MPRTLFTYRGFLVIYVCVLVPRDIGIVFVYPGHLIDVCVLVDHITITVGWSVWLVGDIRLETRSLQ